MKFHDGRIVGALADLLHGLHFVTLDSVIPAKDCEKHVLQNGIRWFDTFQVYLEQIELQSVSPRAKPKGFGSQMQELFGFGRPTQQSTIQTCTLRVLCPTERDGERSTEELLVCRNVPFTDAEILRDELERLVPDNLTYEDVDQVRMAEVLLQHRLAGGLDRTEPLFEALKQVLPDLALCLVLCGQGLRLNTNVPWGSSLEILKGHLAFQGNRAPEEAATEIHFVRTAQEVREEWMKRLGNRLQEKS